MLEKSQLVHFPWHVPGPTFSARGAELNRVRLGCTLATNSRKDEIGNATGDLVKTHNGNPSQNRDPRWMFR